MRERTYRQRKAYVVSIGTSKHSWHSLRRVESDSVLVGLQQGLPQVFVLSVMWDSRDRKKHYIRRCGPSGNRVPHTECEE
ncbi:hypothetical protein AVEN_89131-1 [Araneus ventricosus]|uniref:Uncharacterized protein n=1 Tax=Araneus ventricosus TaxID=182803 RepID=A0A4Y2B3Q0_ARAVE|nr:hypothetical protein AVEN_89131-1 [Araneus ventricosus]